MMHSVIKTLKRYLNIYKTYLRFTFINMMTYRISFVIELVIDLGYIVWLVVFYEILFANVNSIAGWSKPEVMFFIGLSIMYSELMTGLFYV